MEDDCLGAPPLDTMYPSRVEGDAEQETTANSPSATTAMEPAFDINIGSMQPTPLDAEPQPSATTLSTVELEDEGIVDKIFRMLDPQLLSLQQSSLTVRSPEPQTASAIAASKPGSETAAQLIEFDSKGATAESDVVSEMGILTGMQTPRDQPALEVPQLSVPLPWQKGKAQVGELRESISPSKVAAALARQRLAAQRRKTVPNRTGMSDAAATTAETKAKERGDTSSKAQEGWEAGRSNSSATKEEGGSDTEQGAALDSADEEKPLPGVEQFILSKSQLRDIALQHGMDYKQVQELIIAKGIHLPE